MPVCLDRYTFEADVKLPHRKSPFEFRESNPDCLEIGLVNNMPSGALERTERQFLARLEAAADGMVVRLTFLAVPEIPRTSAGQRHVSNLYSDINDLWGHSLDGLIVTGTEPQMPNLRDEPYWGSLVRLLEWAKYNTHSSIWSCLAAHAALLHIDGIERRPLGEKCFGVFECAKVSEHCLTAGVPARLYMPHSRWNGVQEDVLTSCGYRVITKSDAAGVDMFVKHGNNPFVFFQGHPEYDAETLLREYRRDIGRFLRNERDVYPSMPEGYFDKSTADAWAALRNRALIDRREELINDPKAEIAVSGVRDSWSSAAICMYRNWLQYLCTRKEQRLKARQGREHPRASCSEPSHINCANPMFESQRPRIADGKVPELVEELTTAT